MDSACLPINPGYSLFPSVLRMLARDFCTPATAESHGDGRADGKASPFKFSARSRWTSWIAADLKTDS